MTSLRCLIPTNVWVRLAIVPVLVLVAMSVDRQYLLDFWHHLARGEYIVTEGELLNNDIFTYTVTGTYFRDVNWLTQVIYYHVFQAGGLELVQLTNALVLATSFFLVVLFCWQRSGSLGLATAVGIFTFFGSWQVLTIRPQTFSLLLFVLVYWCLDRSKKWPGLLLIPPLLIGLWANLHGAFPAGMMLIGCFLLARAWEAWREGNLWKDRTCWLLTACLFGSLLATCVNPYGWTIYQYVGVTSNRAKERGIMEWLPPNLDLMIGWFWLVSIALLVGLYAISWIIRKRKPRAQEVCLILLFLPMACTAVRMVVWWLIVAAPIYCELLITLLPKAKENEDAWQPSWGAALTFLAMAGLAAINLPGWESINPLALLTGRTNHRPEHDLQLVQQQIRNKTDQDGGRIFTRFEWGEFWTWNAGPQYQVFADARIEIYPDDIWQQYLDLTTGQDNWQQILDKYQVDYLVLDADYHTENGLLAKVDQSPCWQKTFQIRDEIYLYERQTNQTDLQ